MLGELAALVCFEMKIGSIVQALINCLSIMCSSRGNIEVVATGGSRGDVSHGYVFSLGNVTMLLDMDAISCNLDCCLGLERQGYELLLLLLLM